MTFMRRFKWTFHNIIGHPISEMIFVITGSEKLALFIHDFTLPKEDDI
jgi:hypothetical protein